MNQVSERSFKRAHKRRLAAAERRRALLARRNGVATGAAIAATALFAPAAHAAGFEVNTTADHAADACEAFDAGSGADCTLRDAVAAANASAGDDTITFQSGLSGQITLDPTQGQIAVGASGSGYSTTIAGPGAGTLSVSGNDASRIFETYGGGTFALSGLTLTHGLADGDGGAIYGAGSGPVSVSDAVISSNQASAQGGGIWAYRGLNLTRTQLTGNIAAGAGGGFYSEYYASLTDVTASGNQATGDGGGGVVSGLTTITASAFADNSAASGGGLFLGSSTAPASISGTSFTGNDASSASGYGGGLATRGSLALDTAVVSGNSAYRGGGIALGIGNYASVENRIDHTTVSSNTAAADGGGIDVVSVSNVSSTTVARSTISGNQAAGNSFGGGIDVERRIYGDFLVQDATIAGNSAAAGAGIAFNGGGPLAGYAQSSARVEGSTVTGNRAANNGGGLYAGEYIPYSGSATSTPVSLASTIVAGNTAAGAGNDLDRADDVATAGFDTAFSLVQNQGDGYHAHAADTPNILNTDPKLGPLADNGGPTLTERPAADSPVVDQGDSPSRPGTDQRDLGRRVDFSFVPNASDGTDIGAVELTTAEGPLPPAAAPPTQTGTAGTVPAPTPPATTPSVPPVARKCFGLKVTIHAQPGKVTFGTGHRDVILGTMGRDIIRAGGGNDVVCGTAGNDSITGGLGNDVIGGDRGNDHLFGNSGNDQLFGGPGNDRLSGGTGNDVMQGGIGRDKLIGGPGRDRYAGGPDKDSPDARKTA